MNLKTLILGAFVLPFAVAGGAQAADLAVADSGGACPAGAIPSGGVCLLIGGHVREVANFGTTYNFATRAGFFVAATVGNVSAKIKFTTDNTRVASSTLGQAATNNNAWNLDKGSGVWAGIWFGKYDDLPYSGGGFTDFAGVNPDSGGVNQFGVALPVGGSTLILDAADASTMYADAKNIPQLVAQWLGNFGGLAATIAVGWVSRTSGDGTWVNGSLGGSIGSWAWKFWGAWGNNARGGVAQSRTGFPLTATGTDWNVGLGTKIPLGSVFSVAVDATTGNFAGATVQSAAVDFNQQWTPNVDTKEEVNWINLNGTSTVAGFFWFNVAFNGG